MVKKVFSYDLDGTLLMSNNKVHPTTKKAFEDVHKAGGINVINTGRGILKIFPLMKEFQGVDYFICSNGSLIYDAKKKEYKTTGQLSPEVFTLMYEYAKKNDLIVTLDTANFNGTFIPKNSSGQLPDWIQKQDIMDFSNLNICDFEVLNNVAYDKDSIITQVAIRNPIEIAKDTTEYFKKLLGDKYAVYLTNSIYTDINPLGVSKWHGMQEFLKMYNLENCTIYAFGDSGNDVEILKHADYGYAMGNATADAKAVATEIIGDYNSGAIGIKLHEIIGHK
ncbi:HAD family hydrolase [Mycoplasmopsis primatum]|uniref:HAD family hydrolase n=1 Tax=Mycoplasmopsis primatum TaxID=55604 RepID=UPI00049679CC|nr:HAD family hydrolase [Mycoplasmopsis primatum]